MTYAMRTYVSTCGSSNGTFLATARYRSDGVRGRLRMPDRSRRYVMRAWAREKRGEKVSGGKLHGRTAGGRTLHGAKGDDEVLDGGVHVARVRVGGCAGGRGKIKNKDGVRKRGAGDGGKPRVGGGEEEETEEGVRKLLLPIFGMEGTLDVSLPFSARHISPPGTCSEGARHMPARGTVLERRASS